MLYIILEGKIMTQELWDMEQALDIPMSWRYCNQKPVTRDQNKGESLKETKTIIRYKYDCGRWQETEKIVTTTEKESDPEPFSLGINGIAKLDGTQEDE